MLALTVSLLYPYWLITLYGLLIIEKTGYVNRKNDMINKIISEIVLEREKQGLSETALAKKAGLDQNKVWRLLNGKTKRPDLDAIEKLRSTLGLVSEPETPYGVTSVHRTLTPQEEELLKIMSEIPEARDAVLTMALLPERKRKIRVGQMLQDLEDIEKDEKQ